MKELLFVNENFLTQNHKWLTTNSWKSFIVSSFQAPKHLKRNKTQSCHKGNNCNNFGSFCYNFQSCKKCITSFIGTWKQNNSGGHNRCVSVVIVIDVVSCNTHVSAKRDNSTNAMGTCCDASIQSILWCIFRCSLYPM